MSRWVCKARVYCICMMRKLKPCQTSFEGQAGHYAACSTRLNESHDFQKELVNIEPMWSCATKKVGIMQVTTCRQIPGDCCYLQSQEEIWDALLQTKTWLGVERESRFLNRSLPCHKDTISTYLHTDIQIFIADICLRSRPGSPNVVCQSVSCVALLKQNDRMT